MTKSKIYIFLFHGFSDWEIAYLTPELQKNEAVDLSYFSLDGKSVKSTGGLTIAPDYSLHQINWKDASAIILPGGSAWESNTILGLDEVIEQLHSENKTIAAICGATIFLANKGYLDEIEHTSNALFYLQNFAKNYAGSDYYKDELSVTHNNIITANGIAPIEFARDLFKKIGLDKEMDIDKWFKLFKYGIWLE